MPEETLLAATSIRQLETGLGLFSTRIAGIAIRRSQGYIIYCRAQKWVGGGGSGVSNTVDPKKKKLFYGKMNRGHQTG